MGIAGAVIGAGVLGAGASIAAGSAAAGATRDAAEQSNATQLQMYNQTRSDQAPYRAVGYGALNKLAAMYGVKPVNDNATGVYGGYAPPAQNWKGYYDANPDLQQAFENAPRYQQVFSTPEVFAQWHYENYGKNEGRKLPATPTAANDTSSEPYGGFMESPGYQFRVDQATRAIQNSAAARGLLKSGATVKAINNQVQGVASDEFNTYANRLAALAGVGQTSTNATNAAGQNYANNVSNNQMAAGQATASAYQNTGSAINNGVQNIASGYLYSKGYGGGVTGNYGVSNYFSPSAGLQADVGSSIAANAGIF